MTILVDSSEQLPYTFIGVPASIHYAVQGYNLFTGDYCVNRYAGTIDALHERVIGPDCALVERKTLSDLYSTATAGRERFEEELERMTAYGFRALVIEAEWSQILNPNAHLRHATRMRPKAMLASLLAWQQRFGVHIIPCPGRAAAEHLTFRVLERWFRDGPISNAKGDRPA